MEKRGRKSGAELAVPDKKILEKYDRPKPVSGLTPDQGDIWIDIVSDLPADWFPKHTHEILAQYCRHCASVQKIDMLIAQLENGGHTESDEGDFDFIASYDQLLKMRERESRAASSHATRLRITPQATYDKSKSKGKSNAVKRPWEN